MERSQRNRRCVRFNRVRRYRTSCSMAGELVSVVVHPYVLQHAVGENGGDELERV